MPEYTISARSRNLGLGWSNTPVQHRQPNGNSYLGIATPTSPDVKGGLRAVETELGRARRINGSAFWEPRLFIGGEQVTGWWGSYETDGGEWREGWLSPGGGGWKMAISELLHEMREGGTVRVRTAGGE